MHNEKSGTWPNPGPLELGSFPNQLMARVVTPGPYPCLHGYDIESDLTMHYSPTEVAYLALTGELPQPEVAAALEAILVFASAISIAHAATHAAVLARLCGAPSTSILGIAAVGLAEQVKWLLDDHEDLLAWLLKPTDTFPSTYCSSDETDHVAVENLRAALVSVGLHVPTLNELPTRNAALLAALHRCGLVARHQLEAVVVWARLPIVMAEAMQEQAGNFKEYPVNLPHYRYQESPR